MKDLRYLFAYSHWREGIDERYENLIRRHRKRGYDIEVFCVTLDPPGPRLDYPTLDKKWRQRDKKLMRMYKQLEENLKDFDVFILHNGANIHKEFLRRISTFNVYICFDDPESSDVLSKPVAKYFDLALTGNVACVNLYKSWGVRNADYLPLGFFEEDYNPKLQEADILDKDREIDCFILCERQSKYREVRLNKLTKEIPNLFARGRGWPQEYLPEDQRISVYQNSKIGINLHNSVGPVNLRTFMLPANGVMQICDNKHMLGYLYELGEEVVGFDSIDEGIELVKYYLENDDERKQIATNGWKRALKDYSEGAVWERLINMISLHYHKKGIIENSNFSIKKEEKWPKKRSKLSVKPYLKRFLSYYGYEIQKKKVKVLDNNDYYNDSISSYIENPEVGPVNFEEKLNRVNQGLPFEWPNIISLNQTIVSLLGDAKNILEIGSGTGCFAWHAAFDRSRTIVASEIDIKAKEWAINNRSVKNIQYVSKLLSEFKPDSFDIVVTIDVIEHIKDYPTFLEDLSRVAPKAIITTPNRNRDDQSSKANPPHYYQHVREWTTGEFYWILRTFYQDVQLFAMPNDYLPFCVRINIFSSMTPLIAVCKGRYKPIIKEES